MNWHKFFSFFILLVLCSCSSTSSNRKISSESAKKIHVIFVHGLSGDETIDEVVARAKKENRDFFRASLGEFNAIYDELKEAKDEIQFDLFKYRSSHHVNSISAAHLNEFLIKKQIDAGSAIHFITLSNGNLVLREAMLLALGRTQKIKLPSNSALLEIYKRSVVEDVSPILGGAADARTAMPLSRFEEIDPFGSHMTWMFSEENSKAINSLIKDRYTYLICGDTNTRGIWNLMTSEERGPKWEVFIRLTNALRFRSWKRRNLRWFFNFERARGVDRDHHIEFVSDFPGDTYCSFDDYFKKNTKLIEKVASLLKPEDKLLSDRMRVRKSFESEGYFSKKMSAEISDYNLKALKEVYPEDSQTYQEMLSGFYRFDHNIEQIKPLSERTLKDRHSLLIYYMPLIRLIKSHIHY